MALFELLPARGAVGKKLTGVTASIADGGTIASGLDTIDQALVTHGASTVIGGAASAFDATVRSIAGGTVTVTIVSRTTTPALAAYATAANVHLLAIGD